MFRSKAQLVRARQRPDERRWLNVAAGPDPSVAAAVARLSASGGQDSRSVVSNFALLSGVRDLYRRPNSAVNSCSKILAIDRHCVKPVASGKPADRWPLYTSPLIVVIRVVKPCAAAEIQAAASPSGRSGLRVEPLKCAPRRQPQTGAMRRIPSYNTVEQQLQLPIVIFGAVSAGWPTRIVRRLTRGVK
jgi:hypothetical protein